MVKELDMEEAVSSGPEELAALPEQFRNPGIHSRSMSDDEEEDDLALLQKHTKVRIVGNNRTRPAIIGMKGVVRKAVGLGGWHWLVLSSGEEVRLQRNALAVLEQPTGQESDFSDMEDEAAANNSTEMLPKTRPRRPPRPIAHSPDIPQPRRASQRQLSVVQPKVDLHRLETSALKKYRRFYKLADVGPNSTKEQLVQAVSQHWMSQEVEENKVIAMFVQACNYRRPAPAPISAPMFESDHM